MPNVQWMPYSFIQLYFFKCDVCLLNYIWINPKIFLIILYVFGSDFYHSLCPCLVLALFSLFKHVLCWKTSVRIFGYSFWRLASRETQSQVLATHFGDLQAIRLSHEVTQNVLATYSQLASRETPRNSFLKSFFMGNLF